MLRLKLFNPSLAYLKSVPSPKDMVFIIPDPTAVFHIEESIFFSPLPAAMELTCCPTSSPENPPLKANAVATATPTKPPVATVAMARSTPAPAIAPETAPWAAPRQKPLPSAAELIPPIKPPTKPPMIQLAIVPWVSLVGSGLFRQYANILVPRIPCPVLARLSALMNLQISGS